MDDLVEAPLIPVPVKTWARVTGGFVSAVKRAAFHLANPFEDLTEGEHVIDVTGVPCAQGYLVDARGNVAPNDSSRTEPLLPHEAAYHDRSNPPAPPTAAMMHAVSTAEPHAILKAGAEQADGKQDNRGTGTSVDMQAASE